MAPPACAHATCVVLPRAGCLETCLGLVSVSLWQCLVSVSDLESLGKWSCFDRDMKKFWIWNSIQVFDTEATMVLTQCIQSKTLCVISHLAKTFGHILFRPYCFVVQACRIAGFCFLFVSSIYENWSISTTKHMHSMVIYSRPGMSKGVCLHAENFSLALLFLIGRHFSSNQKLLLFSFFALL